jgi:DNA-binding NtrC family response regulator
VLQAADALSWARSQLPVLVAASGAREVLQAVVDVSADLAGAPEAWAISWTLERGSTRIVALAGRSEGELARLADGALVTPEGLSRSIVGVVVAQGRPAWSDDASADSRFLGAASVQAMALRSVGCVPLGERGALYLHDPSSPGRFGPQVRSRIAALCALAAPFLDEGPSTSAPAVEPLPGLVGESPAMRELYGAVRAFAPMPWPVLILGETGTGKEAVARALHDLSPRSGRPFVPVNCGTIPDELAESTLFGHERGAFTGADRRREGVVERVGDGTLFLDEVGELSPRVQVKLLRLLQEGTFERLGDERQRRFQGRVVAATHRPIHDGGTFREDLYHRLSACVVQVPPLRDRRSDLPALAEHLLQRALSEVPGAAPVRLGEAALGELERRAWPGNVRELSNVLRGAVARVLGSGASVIEPHHLASGPGSAPAGGPVAALYPGDLLAATEQFQQDLVRRALDDSDGNKTRAAASLGVSRQWLHRLIARWERQGDW